MPLLGGCSGIQSALDPKGVAARAIYEAWWVMFLGSLVILSLVMAMALYALLKNPDHRWRIGSSTLIIGGGVALPVITITALLTYGVQLGDRLTSPPGDALKIEVTGKQWWWEVRYPDKESVVTANEILIPAGRAVQVELTTEDVIHSFWVPNLAGKKDLIPGKVNKLLLQADEPGVFRGQCAEFCGSQHARMAFFVIAKTPEEFERWQMLQRQVSRLPVNPVLARGRDAFLSASCGECHTIRGTSARGTRGPDLTHVGSRRTIGAGMLETSADNIGIWIVDNQRIKFNDRIPAYPKLDRDTVREIATYLESLQ
ncbi:MAG: cytochrome c oxidase subunit II [Nitrosospira sp.]|nr:cytochrome c oxidase subunit II [Nitrosospira sp.]